MARLAPSFFIICALLLWESYRAVQGQLGRISGARVTLFLVGAVVSFVLGVVGTRERHRRMRDEP
jgi:hypothetical protein